MAPISETIRFRFRAIHSCHVTFRAPLPLAGPSISQLASRSPSTSLKPGRAGLVADLVSLAPVVLFSAAVPGQGGTGHINEQWPEYWAALFQSHGYECLDCIRPKIWRESRVDAWYKQNLLLFVRKDQVARFASMQSPAPLSMVHPDFFCDRVAPSPQRLFFALFRSCLVTLSGRNHSRP